MALRIVTFCGSLRVGSYNKKLQRISDAMLNKMGVEVTSINWEDYDVPMYNGDIEAAGFPESVRQLKKIVESSDAVLFVSPEYNFSIPALTKNVIDWLSRGMNSWGGKVGIIAGASPGGFGTVRMQEHLRQVLHSVGMYVMPLPQFMVSAAAEAFDEKEQFTDVKKSQDLMQFLQASLDFAQKLAKK